MKFVECPDCDDPDNEVCQNMLPSDCACLCHRVIALERQIERLKARIQFVGTDEE